MRSVPQTGELRRILALPQRTIAVDDFIDPLSKWLTKTHTCTPNCALGVTKLRSLQAAALTEAHDHGGLFLVGPIGCGKTAVSVLAPTVFESKRALLVVPGGSIFDKTFEDIRSLSEHWRIVPFEAANDYVPSNDARGLVATYEFLDRPDHADFLFEYAPDLLIFDEAHKLKSKSRSTRRRVARYLQACKVPVLIMSGTPAKRSIRDFVHTMEWALGCNSPLPVVESDAIDWSLCLDAGVRPEQRLAPGALHIFGSDIRSIRQGVRHRLFATPGCVAAEFEAPPCAIDLTLRNVPLSAAEDEPYRLLREDWTTPDGHEFVDAVELWRHARELAMGFYGVWDPRPPQAWMQARRDWYSAVREFLSRSHKLDTERQIRDEIERKPGHRLERYLRTWDAIKDTFTPNSVPRWVGDSALLYAANWLQGGGIAWVEHIPFGERLEALCGVPFFSEGGRSSTGLSIVSFRGRACISSYANATGLNLQHFDRSLICSIKPTGITWDQTMGRLARPGQRSERVSFDVMISCKEQLAGFERARDEDANFHQDLLQIPSRLLYCNLQSDMIAKSGYAWGADRRRRAA